MALTGLNVYNGNLLKLFKADNSNSNSALYSSLKNNNGILELTSEGSYVSMRSPVLISGGTYLSAASGSFFNLGQSGSTVNLNVGGVTYNFGTLTGDISITGALSVAGSLTVNGTQTILNTTEFNVDDYNITLGCVAGATDTTANGGGITLSGTTAKTIQWLNDGTGWNFNQGIKVVADTSYFGAGGATQTLKFLGTASGDSVISWAQSFPRMYMGGVGSQQSAFYFYTNGTSNNAPVIFTAGPTPNVLISGSLGLSITPAYKLDVYATQGQYAARFATSDGYVVIGPQNPEWCHLMTDRGAFYFNKPLATSGTLGAIAGSDLSLATDIAGNAGTTRVTIKQTTGLVGINTSTPAATLDVTCKSRSTDALYIHYSGANDLLKLTTYGDFALYGYGDYGAGLIAINTLNVANNGEFTLNTLSSGCNLFTRMHISAGTDLAEVTFSDSNVVVNGEFYATVKHFKIPDLDNPDHTITYGSLEGPENAVFCRGRVDVDRNLYLIRLPKEWRWLVDAESITVYITPEDFAQTLNYKIRDNRYISIENRRIFGSGIRCSYLIIATRKDVKPLEVYS
jgi:hypothetical protein